MEAEICRSLPFAKFRTRKTGCIIQTKLESLRTRGADGVAPRDGIYLEKREDKSIPEAPPSRRHRLRRPASHDIRAGSSTNEFGRMRSPSIPSVFQVFL